VILILLLPVPRNTAQYSDESHGSNSLNDSETRREKLTAATLLGASLEAVSWSRSPRQMVRLNAAAGIELSTSGLAAMIWPVLGPIGCTTICSGSESYLEVCNYPL
jgi:hypothetical protein